MAQILDINVPQHNPAGAPGNDYERIEASPSAFGSQIGQATERLGGAIGQAAQTGMDALTARQQLNNEVHANEKLTWIANQGTDRLEKFRTLEGKAAVMDLPNFKNDLAKLRSDALDGESPAVQAQLSRGVTSLVDRYFSMASSHASTQERQWYDKTARDSAVTHGTQAALSAQLGTWDDVEASLRKSDDEIAKLGEQKYYDRPTIDAEVAKNRGGNVQMIVKTLVNSGDVRTAQAVFDRYKPQMDAASILHTSEGLKSAVTQLDGRSIADEESGHVLPKADAVAGVPSSFIAQVKRTEGFAPQAKWDVKQFSNGYGTRAKYDGEVISKEEAEQRFQTEFSKAAKIVDSVNPNLDPGTRAALASLTYNAGDAWTHAGLGEKIRSGDLAGAKELFLQYNKADGQTNEGLANRRYREAQWFGSNDAPSANGPLVDKQSAYERVLARTDSNPLLQTAAMARLNQVYSIYHTEQTSQNAAFDRRLDDTRTEALATGTAKAPLLESDFVTRYGVTDGQRRYGEYQKDIALGADISGLATMSPEEQNAVLARHAPVAGAEGFDAEQTRYGAVAKAIAHVNKERDADPAAFAIRRLPAVSSAAAGLGDVMNDKTASDKARSYAAANYAAITLAEQARVGVPAEARTILTAAQVSNIGGAINLAAASDDPAARQNIIPLIKQQADLWGSHWPEVAQQILPNAAPIVKVIAAGADPDAMLRVLSIPKGENPAQILKEQNEVTARNMNNALNVSMAPFLNSMVGLQKDRDYKGYHDIAQKLAALYVRDGKGAEEAAQAAFDDVVGKRYTFADTYRIPKQPNINPDDVQRGAYEARQEILRGNMHEPGSPLSDVRLQRNDIGISDNEADSRSNYSRDGVFVTSAHNDGLNIAYKNDFLRDSSGAPIFLSWDQLQKMGGTKGARAADAARPVFTSAQTP